MHGRLTTLFRDLAWNANGLSVNGLKQAIHNGLRDNIRNFPAVVKIGEWAHFFKDIGKGGHAVTLTFWAWGDDEAMAMANLDGTFQALRGCLEWISDHLKSRQSKT